MTVYFDDSGSDPNQKVAVAAGLIASCESWDAFSSDWDAAMRLHGFHCFHTSECVSANSKSDFAFWEKVRIRCVISQLRSIVLRHAAHGFALGVYKNDYDRIITPDLRPYIGENHYTWAVGSTIQDVERFRRANGAGADQRIEYVFDWMAPGDDKRKEIDALFMALLQRPELALSKFGITAGCWSFRRRCDVNPLQAADMLAWTHYNRVLQEPHPESKELSDFINEIANDSFNEFRHASGGLWFNGRWGEPAKLLELAEQTRARLPRLAIRGAVSPSQRDPREGRGKV